MNPPDLPEFVHREWGAAALCPSAPRRHALAGLGAAALGLVLAGCASPAPARRWLQLPLDVDASAAGVPAPAVDAAAAQAVWQLMPLLALPETLDRDELLVADAGVGLRPLPGVRWAEPLQQALPRLLLHDLQRLRGPARVWAAPIPPGVQPTQQLRVQLLSLDNLGDAGEVRLRARWSLAEPAGRQPPLLGTADLRQPWPGRDADSLVRAQRQALWLLAQRIAAG